MLLPHRHFAATLGLLFHPIFLRKGGMVTQILLAAEQLPYEIKLNGKMIVEWSDRKDPAHYLYLRSSFYHYVNFMSIKVCAENGFSAQTFILC